MLPILVSIGVIGFFAYKLLFGEGIFGMRSDYPAKDFDPRLTQVASSAKPLIDALMKYREKNKIFPPHFGECDALLPNMPWNRLKPNDDNVSDWNYSQLKNGSEFILYHKLGWDPLLKYRYDGTKGSWIFDPGYGDIKKYLQLKP